jgi:hypothetical protein
MRAFAGLLVSACLTAPLAGQTLATSADSAAVAGALADLLRGGPAALTRRPPFNLVRTNAGTPATSWLGRVRAALLARDSALVVDAPSRETGRVDIGAVIFSGDSATISITFSGCRPNSSVAHYATQASYTFRRAGDKWEYAPPLRGHAIAGDSVSCPW